MYEAAEESYRNQSYSEALGRFEKFLEKYPKDENADEARVRIVLCKIRTVLTDPQKAYDRATELLPTVLEEEAFRSLARDELPGILPQIAEGFVKKAKNAPDTKTKEEFIDKAQQAMDELVNEAAYIPSSKRPPIQTTLNRIKEDILLVRREINQDRELAKTIATIKKHVAAGETVEAYEAFKALLKIYPGTGDNADLLAAVQEITKKTQEQVKLEEQALNAVTEDIKPKTEFSVVLATRAGKGIASLNGQAVAVLAGGSVYGLDAGSGHVLWRRFVGYETLIHPVPVSNEQGADMLIVDSLKQQLVRVEAASGKLAWRLPIGEAFSAPTMAGDKAYVATESGKLLELDVASGNSYRRALFPQAISVSCAVAQTHPYIVQPANHSHVYVLDSSSLKCDDVLYLGHKEGAIAVPPLILQDHVFIAENSAPDHCKLHILKITPGGDGPLLRRPQNPILLNGNVVVPMILYGRRPLVVTDRGEIRVLNVDFNADKDTVTEATAPSPASRPEPIWSYPVVEGQSLILADDKLVKYTIQVTTKKILQQSVTNSQEAFIAPPQLVGDATLVVARRRRGSTGVSISALNVDNPRNSFWETDLGVPIARASVSKGQLQVISAAASLFDVTSATLRAGYNDKPTITAPTTGTTLSFTDPIAFPDGRVAFFNPSDHQRALVFNPAATGSARLRMIQLKLTGGHVTCQPVAFKDGLLAPTDAGPVLLANTTTGDNLVLPFQPKLGPGETIHWHRPAVLGDQFVIADDQQNVYRVGIKAEPKPFLVATATAKLDVAIGSDLAAAGDTVYGVVRNSGGDVIVALNASDLKVAKEVPLEGHVVWGPVKVGDVVFCLSDSDGLLCLESGGKKRWGVTSGCGGRPAGLPLRSGNEYVFALVDGSVVLLSGKTGEQVAKADVGEPLGAGPVAYETRLLLPGNDGALHVIPLPKTEG